MRRFLNAASVDEIVFTTNTTAAINTVAYGFGMPNIGEGDEIVLSIMEHHSNIVPWHFIRERQGRQAGHGRRSTTTAYFHLDEFEKLLTDAHASSSPSPICRTCWAPSTPIKEIVRIAHARGIPVLVDGSQGAVHMPVDVQDLDCDFYRLHRPQGLRADRHRRALRQEGACWSAMRPFQGGGEMIFDGDRGQRHLQRSAAPLRGRHAADRPGDRAGRGARLHGCRSAASASPRTRRTCADYAHERLRSINSLRIFGDAPGKGAIVSFELQGIHAARRVDGHRPRRAWRCGPARIARSRC